MDKRKIESHTVTERQDQVRLSDYSPHIFQTITTKTAIKKAIKAGLVYLNGEQGYTADYVNEGDIIDLYKDDSEDKKTRINLKLDILFEDDYLAVIYKPAGIVVSGNRHWTIQNALPKNLGLSPQPDALKRPEPAHRLDYPTSGILLIGKTSKALLLLNQMFREKQILKTYTAIAIGDMPDAGVISIDIDGKPSETIYKTLQTEVSERFGFLNLLELIPKTGRKHQLRKHLSFIGHPILGDVLYGVEGKILKGKGLYLHAGSLAFEHPITQEHIEVSTNLPKKFLRVFPG
jgi:23S rRNA pseudouridine1911/1915/1917 synthase